MEIELAALALPTRVCDAIRQRIVTTKMLSDLDVLTMSILAGCNEAESALEFICSRSMFAELKLQIKQLELLPNEWKAIFVSKNGGLESAEVSGTNTFKSMVAKMEGGLTCTLQEAEQSSRWEHPLPRLLCYIALHSKSEVEEKVASLLGSVVRTDSRKLEDLRTSFESDGSDLILLAAAARASAKAMGLN